MGISSYSPMRNDPIHVQRPQSRFVLGRIVLGTLTAVSLAGAGFLQAQSVQDDFDDGNDAGWMRYDLTAFLNSQGVPGTWADYSFPDDGAGGKAYKVEVLAHPANQSDDLAPRAVPYRGETYSRFKLGVDVLDWAGPEITVALVARATSIGLGSTAGYMFNLNPGNQDMDITLIAGEAASAYLETVDASLSADVGPLRFEFMGSNDALVGHLYRMVDPRAPVLSIGVIDQTYGSGVSGLLVFDGSGHENWTGASATFDNFSSEPLPANTPPQIVFLEPAHLGLARGVPATVRVSIFDIEETVNIVQNSIQLEVDGVAVPNSALTITSEVYSNRGLIDLPGITVTYTPASPPADLSGAHTNVLRFNDTAGGTVRQEWVYSYPVLPPEYALPPGSGESPGFPIRLVQSIANQPLANSLDRAELQLARPPGIAIDLETNTTISVINYTQQAVPNTTPDGYFADHATFPGIDPAGNTDDMAMETLFYLELPQGSHRFGVISDDGFQLRCGAAPADPGGVVLAEKTSGTYDGTFDVIVEKEGIYPFRMVWFERGGGAHVELFTQDPGTGERVLVNDSQSLIKAYQAVSVATVALESSASAAGPFSEVNDASIDTESRQITAETQGSERFYRLKGPSALAIGTIEVQGTTVTLTYTTAP